jgi:hypothetical protein
MQLNAGKDVVAFLAPEISGKRPRKGPQTLALRAGVAAERILICATKIHCNKSQVLQLYYF